MTIIVSGKPAPPIRVEVEASPAVSVAPHPDRAVVIVGGAQANVATDLSYTAATRVLASSTGADATLPLVTSGDAGLAPASGGGTTNFLRADGTWAAPGGGGAPTGGAFTLDDGTASAGGAFTFNDGAA